MCDVLGIDQVTLRELVARREVLRVVTEDNVEFYPVAQIGEDRKLLPGLGDVLAELLDGVGDPWTAWLWLTGRSERRGGRSGWEQLANREAATVARNAYMDAYTWNQ